MPWRCAICMRVSKVRSVIMWRRPFSSSSSESSPAQGPTASPLRFEHADDREGQVADGARIDIDLGARHRAGLGDRHVGEVRRAARPHLRFRNVKPQQSSIGHDLWSSNVAWPGYLHILAARPAPIRRESLRSLVRPGPPIQPPAHNLKISLRNFLSMLGGGAQFGTRLRRVLRQIRRLVSKTWVSPPLSRLRRRKGAKVGEPEPFLSPVDRGRGGERSSTEWGSTLH